MRPYTHNQLTHRAKAQKEYTMYQSVDFTQFCDSFPEERQDTYSYTGKRALFDYLERYEKETGTQIKLDIISICCEFTEYQDAIEAASNYFEFEGMTYAEDGSELETPEQVERKALEFLEERTTVIEFVGGIIIANF